MRAALLALVPAALALPGPVPTPDPHPAAPAQPAAATAAAEPTPAPTDAPAAVIAPRADPTAIWVAVDKNGSPTITMTPHQTVVDGRLTLADAPPYELTGSVFSYVEHLRKTTSTGSRRPVPTGKGKSGAFSKCFAKDDVSPWCEPLPGGKMLAGKTYYITWDPKFFKNESAVAKGPIQISLEAHRLGDTNELGDKRWSTKDKMIPARYGVYPWKIPKSVLRGKTDTNVTLVMRAHYKDSDDEDAQYKSTEYIGPTILVDKKPIAPTRGNVKPDNPELYIVLPIMTIIVFTLLICTCVGTRRLKHFDVGTVKSRARKGKLAQRFGRDRRKKRDSEERAVMLDDWDGKDSGEDRPVLKEELERQEKLWNARKF